MNLLTFLIVALASYRLWRIVGRDDWPPSRWFRKRIATTIDDIREGIVGQGSDWDRDLKRRAWFLEEAETMLECPWCLGAWITAAVTAWTDYLVGLPLPVFYWLAAATVVGLVGSNLDD